MQYRSDVIEVISLSDLLDDLRRVGGVVVPREVVYRFINSVDEESYRKLVDEVVKIASWYGTLVKVKRGPNVETLKLVLNVWFPDMNVNVVRGEDGVRLIASSSKQPIKVSRLAGAVIKELCRALDLRIKELVVEEGIVKAEIEELGSGGFGKQEDSGS